MKEFVVEIADENDGFIVVYARSAIEAEVIAEKMGYTVLYAHFEYEE